MEVLDEELGEVLITSLCSLIDQPLLLLVESRHVHVHACSYMYRCTWCNNKLYAYLHLDNNNISVGEDYHTCIYLPL